MVALGGIRRIHKSKLEVAFRLMDRVGAIKFILGYGYETVPPEVVEEYLGSFFKEGRMTKSYPYMNELSRK
jgi:hypothetical protein